ncbi:L,D-transpeptidase family protein [Clostridium sp.]|uniref:L,D-transpeptidase family protein n=1 Tax=Clostridium sp. TaxID=1506 RepID=UPI00261C9017|nr:L,D-transpeptidase family protein [Clostridium sp.]
MERHIKKRKLIKSTILISCSFLILYLSVSIYFSKHFYIGSEINSISVSGKTEEEAEVEILSKIKSYTLDLEGRDNMNEQIKGSEIELKYNLVTKIKELKDSQNPLGWFLAIFKPQKYKVSEIVNYNEKLLKDRFDKFSYFDKKKIVEPQNPSLKYTENGYSIVDEVYGNKINKDILYKKVIDAISTGQEKISLEAANCYENPKYTSKSQEVINAKNMLNKYTSVSITYSSGGITEILDGATIHNWLNVNENFEITFNKIEIGKYIGKLGEIYNTADKTRNFSTSLGTTVKVSGGTYGWLINKPEEMKELIEIIQEGKSVTREPIYKQTALYRGDDGNDIGNTYVEINMTRQHLWFYKKGLLVVEGDIVTGNVEKGNKTPEGTFMLEYKQKDATLKGENYRTSVKFWMPFYGSVGIHDASWRGNFGGNIYKTNGSHGCVNAPLYLANIIFNNIEEGTPIICYS